MRKTLMPPLDLRAPGAIDALLAFHHALVGDARMEGGDTGTSGDGGQGTGDGQQGAGDAGSGSGTGSTSDAGSGAQGGQQQAPTWNPDAWDGKVESLPPAAQKMINDLRKADGDERVAKKTLDAIVKALNPDAAGVKPTPEQLAQQLTDAQTEGTQAKTELTQATVELTVWRTATQHGGNPAALTDSRSFLAKVANLDPSAEDFTTKVIDAAKAAVTENPTLAAAPARAAGSSSADHAGGSGEGARKATTLEEAIARQMAR